jgi:hypothetical protein
MQARVRRTRLSKKSAITLLASLLGVGLCAFQFGDRNELNQMPFAEVRPWVSNLAKARSLAKQGNIDLFVGQVERGETVKLRGQVTDVNCYVGSHRHAYDHAFCAKLCAAAGGPLLFVSDQGGPAYLVLNEENGIRLPADLLDRIGVPGIVVKGKVLNADGLRVLAVEGIAR